MNRRKLPLPLACPTLLALTLALLLPPAAPADDGPTADSPPPDPFADNNCVRCHRDLPGRMSQIVELEWKHSVHYQAKVGCEGCHGGDATLKRAQFDSDQAFARAAHLQRHAQFLTLQQSDDPFISAARGRSISYLCGKCHADIKEKHLGSSHGDFGQPTCLYCHGGGSHRIEPATADIIDLRPRSQGGRCSPCHAQATMQAVKQIKNIVVNAEQQIRDSGRMYRQLEAMNYHNLQLEQLHHHAAEVHSRLRQIFHSFNMRQIHNFAAEIQDVADRTEETYHLIVRLRHEQRRQTLIGLLVVLMLLAFAGLLVYYKHAFLESESA